MNNEVTTPTPTPTTGTLDGIGTRLMDTVTPWVPLAIALVVVALILLMFTPFFTKRYLRWKEVYGYTRAEALLAPFKAAYRSIYKLIKKKPAPFYRHLIQPPALLAEKEKLMIHPEIRDAITAKSEEHTWITERGTYTKNTYEGSMWDGSSKITGSKEVAKKYYFDFSAWLSPYPGTVKYLCKHRPNYNAKTERYLPRKWVRLMADRIIIREATHKEAPGLIYEGAGYGYFVIEVYADHTSAAKLRPKLEENIKSALKLESLRELEKDNPRKIVWLALKHGVKTPLENDSMPTGEEFVQANPANESLTRIPFAVSETGKPWVLVPHHTLLVGKSGAGKSSLLNMLCSQLSDAILDGRAEMFAIDPKVDGEIRTQWGRTNFFKEIANVNEVDRWVTIIDRVYELMESKDVDDSKFTRDTLSADALKQNTFKASKKTPLRVLFIEELPSFMEIINQHPEGKRTVSKLNQILRKGRSSGHFIFSAAQNIERAKLEPLDPKGFINKMALALNDSPYINDLVLGEGAAGRGYDARKLNPKDNPEHPGLGYAVGEDGDPVMIRFPYFDSEQLVHLLAKHISDEVDEPATSPEPAQEPLEALELEPLELEPLELEPLELEPLELDAIEDL